MEGTRLRLTASAAAKERRLEALLAGRTEPLSLDAVRAAQVDGSLALAGLGPEAPLARAGLLRAATAVAPDAPLSAAALLTWHREAIGGGAFRARERERAGGPPPAPAARIAGRIAILEEWMGAPSALELKASQQGALALARVIEVMPFDEGNGRVARLAAAHVMMRAGARPPILVAGDADRLVHTLQAAFQLHTEPLSTLLEEAAERALDVLIREAAGSAR